MPKRDSSFVEYVVFDLLGFISGISYKGMFSGFGVYKDGVVFALVLDGKLYFQTDKEFQKEFEKYGSKPFTYYKNGDQKCTLNYWELPQEIADDRESLKRWVDKSCKISLAGKR